MKHIHKKLAASLIISVLSISIVGLVIWKNHSDRLRKCPTYWGYNQEPIISSSKLPEDRQYLIIGGSSKSLKEVDLSWIKRHCVVNKPEASF